MQPIRDALASVNFYRYSTRSKDLTVLTAIGALSSAVEHFVDIEGVTGSIPVVPTMASSRPVFLDGARIL